MIRRAKFVVSLAILATTASFSGIPGPRAQDQAFTREILARARVFPEVAAGVTALKRDSAGRYYVLARPATAIQIYGPDGSRAGQVPNANSRGAKISYAQDFDLDASGQIFVADRGANAVKVFAPDGSLTATVRVIAPTSIAALSGGEFAVTSLRSDQLVSVFDAQGANARSFGDLPAVSQVADRNALLSHGRIYGDAAGHIYFAFSDLPDPTIRKYDRVGYVSYEISLPASEFKPRAEARVWTTVTIEKGGSALSAKPVIDALGVDPETQEVWAAIGDELVHFDIDGNRRSAYYTSTKEGARIAATAILVEHNRILIAADPFGVFEFAFPEARQSVATSHQNK
jgi:hypothetical protein